MMRLTPVPVIIRSGPNGFVHAHIPGSILGTGLLGLGLAIVVGGTGRERQTFMRERASLLIPDRPAAGPGRGAV